MFAAGGRDDNGAEARAIIDELARAQDLPRETLRLASGRRADLAAPFIGEIESFLAAPAADRDRPNALFYIFHLLGEWREKSAYRPLARLLRRPSGELDAIFDDGIVETAHRVMAAVFDGDPQPMCDIILDPEADEYVRSRMCEALAILAVAGRLGRDDAARFLHRFFSDLKPVSDNFVWHGWQSAIAMLGAEELTPLVKQAFERGSIDPQWLGFADFEQDLARARAHPDRPWPHNNGEFTLWGDTVAELSTWYGFSEQYKRDQERLRRSAEERAVLDLADGPSTNPFKGVGRNDPCPCGSGTKFKKCCLP